MFLAAVIPSEVRDASEMSGAGYEEYSDEPIRFWLQRSVSHSTPCEVVSLFSYIRASISPLEERHAVSRTVCTRAGVIGRFKLFRSPRSSGLISLFHLQTISLHSPFHYLSTPSLLTPLP